MSVYARLVSAEIERGEGRERAGDADRLFRVEVVRRERLANGARGRVELILRGRVGVDEAFREADGADFYAHAEVVEQKLRRAAADVEHERLRLRLYPAARELG